MSEKRNKLENFKETRFAGFLKQYASQLIFLLVLFVFLSVTTEYFLTPTNLINVSRQIATNVYVACALTLILITGGIDLSTSSVIALAGMVSGMLSYRGVPFAVCLLAGLASGAVVGLVNGLVIANTTLPPFIVTYAMQSVLRGLVYVVTGAATLRLSDPAFVKFGGGSLGFLPWPVVYLIIVVIATYLILDRTKLGRNMYAIGGNAKAAKFAGINVKKARVFIYVASGFLAALAGMVYTSRNTSMQPALGVGLEMDGIAAVVLGGTAFGGGSGSIIGTLIGCLIIGFINNGLNLLRLDTYYQYICKGLIILFAVYMDDVKKKRMLQAVGKD